MNKSAKLSFTSLIEEFNKMAEAIFGSFQRNLINL